VITRTASRFVAVGSATVAAAFIAAPAGAQVPEGWSNPKPVSFLHALLVLGGIPLGLFVLIALLVSVPGWVSGAVEVVSAPDTEWFGGPRKGTHELADPDDETSKAGGASVRW
jgi:hypothetical protein